MYERSIWWIGDCRIVGFAKTNEWFIVKSRKYNFLSNELKVHEYLHKSDASSEIWVREAITFHTWEKYFVESGLERGKCEFFKKQPLRVLNSYFLPFFFLLRNYGMSIATRGRVREHFTFVMCLVLTRLRNWEVITIFNAQFYPPDYFYISNRRDA